MLLWKRILGALLCAVLGLSIGFAETETIEPQLADSPAIQDDTSSTTTPAVIAATDTASAAEAADPQTQAAPSSASSMTDSEHLMWAIALLVLALVLVVLEIMFVSFGILGAAAIGCALFAIINAFAVDETMGWIFTALTPAGGFLALKFGLQKLRQSHFVTQEVVSADAGAHHITDRLGIAVDSIGTLVTDAMPGGRCRFAGGECDVHVKSGALDAGETVIVRKIDGPTIIVVPHTPSQSDTAAP